MKKYKQIECCINLILLIAFLIWFFTTNNNGYFSERFLVLFFGGIALVIFQLISLIIQHIKGWFKNAVREVLQYTTYGLAIILLIYPYFCMLIPVLFIFYTCLCFFEYNDLKKSLLKKEKANEKI